MAARGIFITLEGGEGAGKSTQAKRLVAAFEEGGHSVVLTREPGGTPGAEAIRELLIRSEREHLTPKAECLLLFAARQLHVEKKIRPALEAGKIVICDRFTDSTRAYQGAGLGVDTGWIEALKDLATDGLEPDLTLILDIDARAGMARATRRRGGDPAQDRYEDSGIAFHERLRQGYLDIARNNPERCQVIDAARPEDEVFADIWKAASATGST